MKSNKKRDLLKLDWKFVVGTLIVTLIVIPVAFNFLFMSWHNKNVNGESSDWFTFYGNIFGGLLGGFFTYISLLVTFRKQEEDKIEEKRPRIDIPYQIIEFTEQDDKIISEPVKIEINNIGGSLAKNIQCTLSLPNFDNVIMSIQENKEWLGIDAKIIEPNVELPSATSVLFTITEKDGAIDYFYFSFSPTFDFVGSCVPIVLNHEAKVYYQIPPQLDQLINLIVRKKSFAIDPELFILDLKVNYSSVELGEDTQYFRLEWKMSNIKFSNPIEYRYVLTCKELKEANVF